MSTNVLHAPQTIGFGARRLMYIALGLVAVALVVVALASSSGSGSSTVSGSAVTSGRAVSVAHPNEAAIAATVGKAGDGAVPPGSGVPFGRGRSVPETNLLPK